MPSVENDEVLDETNSGFNSKGGGKNIKIPEGKTPIYILESDYHDGYVHYVRGPDGKPMRVVCAGGIEGKGFKPDNCKICKETLELYQQAKALEADGDKHGAADLRKKAGNIRASYNAEFIVVVGEMMLVRGKDGKKVKVPDFENDSVKVGVLTMTEKQYKDFTGLRNNEIYPFIKTGKDLTNRVFVLDKQKRDGKSMATIEFIPMKSASDKPDIEYDPDDFNTEADFEIDEDRIEQAYKMITRSSDDDDDTQFDDEDASPKHKPSKKAVDEDNDDADFLDDEDEEEGDTKESSKPNTDDDDFEDDDPEEDFKKRTGRAPKSGGTQKKKVTPTGKKKATKTTKRGNK